MAFKETQEQKNKIYSRLRGLLWVGKTKEMIDYLEKIDGNLVKNVEQRDYLIDFFRRKCASMPCYALRKVSRLKNSSNTIEKMNDILVSTRQQGLGMSFSSDETIALASLMAVQQNNQLESLMIKNEVSLSMVNGHDLNNAA